MTTKGNSAAMADILHVQPQLSDDLWSESGRKLLHMLPLATLSTGLVLSGKNI